MSKQSEPNLGGMLFSRRMAEARERKARWLALREMDAVCETEGCFTARGVNGRWCLPHRIEHDKFQHSGHKRLVGLPVLGGSMWNTRSW